MGTLARATACCQSGAPGDHAILIVKIVKAAETRYHPSFVVPHLLLSTKVAKSDV